MTESVTCPSCKQPYFAPKGTASLSSACPECARIGMMPRKFRSTSPIAKSRLKRLVEDMKAAAQSDELSEAAKMMLLATATQVQIEARESSVA